MNKIEIPKEVFENIFFSEGGQKKDLHKAMTGEYQFALNMDKPVAKPNAEVEGGEYILDSRGIRKFEGKSHENGGMPVKLEDGSKIISNHLKIGVDLAKELNKSLKLPFKATDTYAKALDRFTNASGLTKINDELQSLIAKVDEQKGKSKDKETFALNNQFLNNSINTKNKEKEPLEKERAKFFNMLFQTQEQTKKEESNYKMQMGGDFLGLASKYNLDPERAKELVKNLPHYQDGNIENPFTNLVNGMGFGQDNEVPEGMSHTQYWENQAIKNSLGNVSKKAPVYTPEEKNTIKNSYSKIVKDKNSLNELYKAIDSDSLVYNPGMLNALKEGKRMPLELQHKDNPEGTYGQQDEDKLNGYLYKDSLGKKFEPGNPEFTKELYNAVSNDLKQKGINWNGSPFRNQITAGIGNVNEQQPGFVVSDNAKKSGQIDLDAYRNQSPGSKQMIADEYGKTVQELDEAAKNRTNKFLKLVGNNGSIETPNTTPVNTQSNPTGTLNIAQRPFEINFHNSNVVNSDNKSRAGLLMLPDQTPLPPSSVQPNLKIKRRYSRIGYNDISPEEQLSEMNRSETAYQDQLKDLSPEQRAAAIIGLTANSNMSSNKVIADVNRANAAGRNAVDTYNAKISDAEENAAGSDALNYEQRQQTAQGNYDKELHSFYNRLGENQMNNWKTVEALNRYNALNPDVQFTGQKYEVNPNPNYNQGQTNYVNQLYAKPQETKKTRKTKTPAAKFGGRFKK